MSRSPLPYFHASTENAKCKHRVALFEQLVGAVQFSRVEGAFWFYVSLSQSIVAWIKKVSVGEENGVGKIYAET